MNLSQVLSGRKAHAWMSPTGPRNTASLFLPCRPRPSISRDRSQSQRPNLLIGPSRKLFLSNNDLFFRAERQEKEQPVYQRTADLQFLPITPTSDILYGNVPLRGAP